MSLDLKSPVPASGIVYSDFLLQLEENPTPETLQRLHLKIDQLEEKLLEQTRLAHCKELEIHNKHDEKKGQITFKYLQIKAELASFKALYKEKENLWQRDSSSLLRVIKCLFKTLSQSEDKMIKFMKEIEGALVKETCQMDIGTANVCHTKRKSERSSIDEGRQASNDEYKEVEVKKEVIFETPKQNGLGFSRAFSPEPFSSCKNLFVQAFKSPTVEIPSIVLSEASDLCTPQPLVKGPALTILSVQKKIRDYITELTEHSATQRLKMDKEINEILRRVTAFKENFNLENSSLSSEKVQDIFVKPSFSHNKNSMCTPFNRNTSHRLPSYSISTNLINELEAHGPPRRTEYFYTEQKYQQESYRTALKHQEIDHQNTQNDLVRKQLDELQNSLALSEKEALLFMLMDNLDNKPGRDVNLDDLLKISNNNKSSILLPQSHSKLADNSMSSFYNEGSVMKDAVDYSNVYISSPHFAAEASPQLNQFTIFTPIAKKGMNRPSSPRLAAEIDMYLQNVDLGSFVYHHEEQSHHMVNTPDLNDLSRDGISPILSRQKKISQNIPNFPTSAEKEYGRRLGGLLDFDDEHVDNFDLRYIKEEESASTGDYGRLPTAEGTESGGKGKKRVDSQQEIGGEDCSESNERTKEFIFQTFSARK